MGNKGGLPQTDSYVIYDDDASYEYRRTQLYTFAEAVRKRAQFVRWLYGYRKGERTKVPIDPDPAKRRNGEPLRINYLDPNNWLPFDEAVADVGPENSVEGIGYVLSAADPFTVIDLDNCRDPYTGLVDQWAQDLVDRFDSYTEIAEAVLREGKIESFAFEGQESSGSEQ